jgi:hypothetical protein
MNILSRLKLRTKLALLPGLSILTLIAVIARAASLVGQQMMDTASSERTLRRQIPEVGAGCGKSARTVLCGARAVRRVPTAILIDVCTTSRSLQPEQDCARHGLAFFIALIRRSRASISARISASAFSARPSRVRGGTLTSRGWM